MAPTSIQVLHGWRGGGRGTKERGGGDLVHGKEWGLQQDHPKESGTQLTLENW